MTASSALPTTPAAAGSPARILRAGIIGAGRMGITHFSLLGSHPQVEVAAVADDSSIVTGSLSRYRPDIKLYGDYRKMLSGEKLDLALICTPPSLHAEMIEACLDHDVSVFVEKPFTLTLSQSQAVLAKARAKGSLGRLGLQVGYVNRFNDVFMKARRLLGEGLIGRPLSFRSEMFGRTVIKKDSGSGWRSRRENGGGCLYEFGSHAIDLAIYLMGKPDRVVGTYLSSLFSEHAEDLVRSTFIYPNGLTGSLYVNWSDESCRKPTNKIEILGEEGKLLADQHELKIYLKNAKGAYRQGWNTIYITDLFTPVPFYVRGNEFTRQIYHLVDCVLKPGQENLSGFAEAAKTQEVMDWIFADSLKQGGL
jgi:scyllo-inositol 2-dehydrogenase (NADP+)